MNGLLQDLRFTLRQWLRRPALPAVVALTLALGIGANTAIFSVVDSVLLRPLPYGEADRLVSIYSQFPGLGFDRFWISPPEYDELRRWSQSLDEVGAYRTGAASLTGGDRPQRVRAARLTATLFDVLGVSPAEGRTFTAEEDLPDSAPVAVLSHRIFEESFGGDRSLLGATVEIDGLTTTVLGVMPPEFDLDDEEVDVWLPLAVDLSDQGRRGNHFLNLVGRLSDEASLEAASLEVDGLVARWSEEIPDTHVPSPDRHPLVVRSLKEMRVGAARPALKLLTWAVGLVLLIACANVANLLLARAEARQREIAVRTAIGVSQARLIRQFLTESVMLALLGGLLGVGLAFGGLRAVLAANPEGVARAGEIGIDGRTLAFTAILALVTGLIFGLAPALHSRGGMLSSLLKEGARATAGRGRLALRRGMVIAEVALASLLVIGAGLLMRSFWNLSSTDPGFDASSALTFQLSLPASDYPETTQIDGFLGRLLEDLSGLPGTSGTAAMTGLPPVRDMDANDTRFEGVAPPPDGPPQNIDYYQTVTDGYLEAMRIPLIEGRPFARADAGGDAPVVLVNETLAKVFWPGESPIGKRVMPSGTDTWFTVVGLVGDVHQGGLDQEIGTELYFFAPQVLAQGFPLRTFNLVVRSSVAPLELATPVREAVARIDPTLPVASIAPLERVVSGSVAGPRFLTLLVGVFATAALLLAAVGTYGVMSYAVEERRHEMGVRLALGARGGSVLRLVLGQGLALTSIGLLVGVAGAFALQRLLASHLHGVTATDPTTFLSVAAILVFVALAASLLPALRAAWVDPIETLRQD